MPYKLRKSGSGYKVSSPGRTYSKKPMSKEKAKRQLAALHIHTGEAFDPTLAEMFGEASLPHKTKYAPPPDPGAYLLFQSPEGYHVLTPNGNEQWFKSPTDRDKYLQWHRSFTGNDRFPVREVDPSGPPKMESVFKIREAPVQNRPPPGSQPVKDVDWTKMGQMGNQLKTNLQTMNNMGQPMNAYMTPQGDRVAFPKDSAPGRPPLKADTTKGIWTPVTGSATGAPSSPMSPTTTTTK